MTETAFKIYAIENLLLDGGSCDLITSIGIIKKVNKIGNPIENGYYLLGVKYTNQETIQEIKEAEKTFYKKERLSANCCPIIFKNKIKDITD